MTAELEAKLARLKNRSTRYELAISKGDIRYLVVYTPRKGFAGIWNVITDSDRANKLIALTGSKDATNGKRAADGVTMGEWKINFTGRTQRDCYIGGELTHISDLPI